MPNTPSALSGSPDPLDVEAVTELEHAARGLHYALDELGWVAWAFSPENTAKLAEWNYDYAATKGAKLLTGELPAAEVAFAKVMGKWR